MQEVTAPEPALVMQATLIVNTGHLGAIVSNGEERTATEAWILRPNYLAVKALEDLTGKGLFDYLRDHQDDRMQRYAEILFACSASHRKNTRHKDMSFEQFLECLPYAPGQLEEHRKMATELVEGSFFGETVRSYRQEVLNWCLQKAQEREAAEARAESTGTSTPTSPSKSSVSRRTGSGSASPTTTSKNT